jgi:hypothetical protein
MQCFLCHFQQLEVESMTSVVAVAVVGLTVVAGTWSMSLEARRKRRQMKGLKGAVAAS